MRVLPSLYFHLTEASADFPMPDRQGLEGHADSYFLYICGFAAALIIMMMDTSPCKVYHADKVNSDHDGIETTYPFSGVNGLL